MLPIHKHGGKERGKEGGGREIGSDRERETIEHIQGKHYLSYLDEKKYKWRGRSVHGLINGALLNK